jgi:hypothetical protein
MTGILTRSEIYVRKREKPRLTAKYLTGWAGTTEFPLIGKQEVWGAGGSLALMRDIWDRNALHFSCNKKKENRKFRKKSIVTKQLYSKYAEN